MTHALDEFEVIWPLHRWHYLSPALTTDGLVLPTAPDAADGPSPPTGDAAPSGRDLAARALLAGPDGSPQRVSELLDVSRPAIDQLADADCSPALRDLQVLEAARMCVAETADRGSSVEEREAALAWLQEAARDERQQFAAARREIGAVPAQPQFPAELMRPEGASRVGAIGLREGEQLAQFLGVAVPERPLEHRHVLRLVGPLPPTFSKPQVWSKIVRRSPFVSSTA